MDFPHRFPQARTLFFLILLLFPILPLLAEEPKAEPQSPPPVPESLSSPRATMGTFLHAMNDIKRGEPERIDDAITTLDLSDVNSLVRAERGRDLAWMLLEVMDRTRVENLKRVPNKSKGKPYVFHKYDQGSVRISRTTGGSWLFERETIARLPEILDGLSDAKMVKGADQDRSFIPWHIRIRQKLPETMKQAPFLLENWHWIGLFLIIVLGVVADKLVSMLLRIGVRRWRAGRRGFDDLSDEVLRPLGLMAMAMIWLVGINLIGLPEQALLVLLVAVKFLASVSGVWAAYRLVDLISIPLMERARRTESKIDDALVPLVPRSLKIFVTVIGFIFIADNLNIDISSLLAGLGLGGLAFALAAKDMVQNLFGSVTVLMDRTFSVGDWVVVGDTEGTVERIGFRSTRMRTFYNSVVTIPNSRFITAEVDNMGERRFRRLSCKLSLTYDTPPDRIDAFCEGVRELVRQHPYMRKDNFHVYLNEFAAASLDVLLYVFWQTPDWSTELRERHRFLLDILRLAQRLGVEFAFPTQTLYMRQEEWDAAAGGSEMPQDSSFDLGRREARAIVEETTGIGVKPPPVTF
jgi:MscS family membrane protein